MGYFLTDQKPAPDLRTLAVRAMKRFLNETNQGSDGEDIRAEINTDFASVTVTDGKDTRVYAFGELL